jgi:hypothetical protein
MRTVEIEREVLDRKVDANPIAETSGFPKPFRKASRTSHCTAPASYAKCVLVLALG